MPAIPIRTINNPYIGINAHLHSLWQHENSWGSFHTRHVVELANALTAQLLPLGYIAEVEESLQIRRVYRADILITQHADLPATPSMVEQSSTVNVAAI